MEIFEKVVVFAESQVGYHEDASGNNQYAKYIDENCSGWYNGRKYGFGADWCTIFVDYCFIRTYGRANAEKLLNANDKTYGKLRAGVRYMWGAFKSMNRTSTTPAIGCVIFFGKEPALRHVGIVKSYDKKYIYTIEGNTADSVKEHKYSFGDPDIFGFGIPDWGKVEPAPAPDPALFIVGKNYKITCKETLNIRKNGLIKAEKCGELQPGTIIECAGSNTEGIYTWIKIANGLYICGRENGINYVKEV